MEKIILLINKSHNSSRIHPHLNRSKTSHPSQAKSQKKRQCMDFAELEKDTASRDEWLLMCRKQNVFSQMILIKDDIHYGQINSDFLQTTFFPFATFLFLKKNLESAFHITWMMNLYSQLSKTLSGIYYNKGSNFPSLETPQARNKSGIQSLHSTLFSM